jgi:hypothetical protein
LSDRLDTGPRRLVIVENDGAFAELIERWLASHGLRAVPIGGADVGAGPEDIGLGRSVDDAGGGHDIRYPGFLTHGPLEIDTGRLEVRVEGTAIHLTPTEFRLLLHLAQHHDRVVGHRELLMAVWGSGYEDDVHLLQVTIRSLRARIALVSGRSIVETVYGTGYRLASLDGAFPGRSA